MSDSGNPSTGSVLVFDSGMGGLTIAREIMALAPGLAVDYAADSGFFPYGDKSDAALTARLPAVARALVEQARPDVFVIACNTASTLALEAVRDVLDIPVVGTVPAIKPAAGQSETGVIGLLATPGTVRRAYTARLIAEFAKKTKVIMHGSVELVQLAEEQASGQAVALEAFRKAQRPLFEADGGDQIDTVVLACTHFPLIRGELAATVPHPVSFVDSGEAIARQTLRVMPVQTLSPGAQGGRVFLTSAPEGQPRLIEVCRRFGFSDTQLCSVT
ncbi:glutamate racemase [Hyphomonas sp. FCG-A18]|jgi:glutamate racemase|uniref:glutamate racemase n=1 Tax=Hyphomonas sp. FCG-A18 TaxID=3080019 RepID=UPI002B2F7C72|nr:glutamate racemase [Hyphomonas sp. FCG-A18]